LFLLGALFVGTTLLLPRGVVGTINHIISERKQRAAVKAEPAARPAG
jgi:hypothetical protein